MFLQNLKYIATVIEFRFFNQIEGEQHEEFVFHTCYIKFFTFYVSRIKLKMEVNTGISLCMVEYGKTSMAIPTYTVLPYSVIHVVVIPP